MERKNIKNDEKSLQDFTKIFYETNKKLIFCDTLDDSKNYFDIMVDGLFSLFRSTNPRFSKSDYEANAKYMLQMFFTKCLSIKHLLEGVNYDYKNSKEVYSFRSLMDFPSLLSLTRDLYEALCVFELIYIYPKKEEHHIIMYNLYVIQGLSERQKYYSEEYKEAKDLELDLIEKARQQIKNTCFYLQHKECQKQLDYIMNECPTCWRSIDENRTPIIKKFNQENDYTLFGIKEGVFKDLYSYLSVYAHPTYLSVLQYKDAFRIEDNRSQMLACNAIRNAIVIMSFYISDYCGLFPDCEEVLNEFNIEKKLLIGFYDDVFRNKHNI
ncbi:MAG: hypothetical protein IJK92_02170 [Bacteroidales bacterium]|nr:hypothetical protein [Bacteroidales bacterium]